YCHSEQHQTTAFCIFSLHDALPISGDWALTLAEAVGDEGEVVGLDFSKNMLSIAEEKRDALNLSQLDLVHGDAMELPFPDDTFEDRKSTRLNSSHVSISYAVFCLKK